MRRLPFSRPTLSLLLIACALPQLWAAQPTAPVEPAEMSFKDPNLLAKAMRVKESGRLLSKEKIEAALKAPTPGAFKLPKVSSKQLEAHEVAARARRAMVRIGWFYLCPRCEHWHANLAGGYAISQDGAIATCHHCVSPDNLEMREGYLIAMDPNGTILPVTGILAQSEEMDTAVVRVEGGSFGALPLNDSPLPGHAAFCYSDPLGVAGYFSAGIVNRMYQLKNAGGDATQWAGAKFLRLHVSTDWAMGSSGAAVLDQCGNAIGHVSTINTLSKDGEDPAKQPKPNANGKPGRRLVKGTLMVLHEAVTARGVKLLLEKAGMTEKK